MADVTLHVRVRSVSGLASCGRCGVLCSFDRPTDELEKARCPCCGGDRLELHPWTLFYVIEVEPGP